MAQTLAMSWEPVYSDTMAEHSDETYVAELVRTHDRDRWLTAALTPQNLRIPLIALYCLNVEIARIPDLVSEDILGQIRLQWWREGIESATGGDPPDHPALRILAPPLNAGTISNDDLEKLLETYEAELSEGQPQGFPQFEDRCRGTGGALSRMAVALLLAGGGETNTAAEAVGTAHAMAGHLRNTAWLASRGRVSLPRDVLARNGIDRENLLAGRPGEGLAKAAREIADRARSHLGRARTLRTGLSRDALPVLLLARATEVELRRLKQVDFDLFSARTEPLPIVRTLAVFMGAVTGRF